MDPIGHLSYVLHSLTHLTIRVVRASSLRVSETEKYLIIKLVIKSYYAQGMK